MEYNNIYEIRKAWCAELGIDASAAQNIYEVSLLLLDYYSGGTPVPPVPPTPPTIDYNGLILTALEDNCSVTWYHGQYPEEMYTSTDGTNWESWDGSAISMDEGDKLCLKGLLRNGARYPSNIYITGKVNAEGNIMSLTDDGACSALTIEAQQFQYLFSGCTGLEISGLTIPATEVKVYGCRGMFSGCTSITKAPELHATIVAASGYSFMFQGCTSLTSAPSVLPATSLSGYTDEARDVYRGMFAGCTSLTGAPVLCATTLSTSCYCGMFHGCTSLTTAPELPATTLASHCYDNMFAGCSSLSSITTYAQDISASMALNNWLKDVASEGDFYNYGGANYSSGKSGIPTGWTEHGQPHQWLPTSGGLLCNGVIYSGTNWTFGSDEDGDYYYNNASDEMIALGYQIVGNERFRIKLKYSNPDGRQLLGNAASYNDDIYTYRLFLYEGFSFDIGENSGGMQRISTQQDISGLADLEISNHYIKYYNGSMIVENSNPPTYVAPQDNMLYVGTDGTSEIKIYGIEILN